MISATTYLKPNITIETEIVESSKFYVYNYKGVYYRVFNSMINLQKFIKKEYKTWIFECSTEDELEKYLYRSDKVH